MAYCSVDTNKIIIEEKTLGNCLYVLKYGTVEIIINNKVITELKSPIAFGERALLSGTVRSSTVKAKEPCFLYVLDKDKFFKLFNQTRKEVGYKDRREVIENNQILSKIYNLIIKNF